MPKGSGQWKRDRVAVSGAAVTSECPKRSTTIEEIVDRHRNWISESWRRVVGNGRERATESGASVTSECSKRSTTIEEIVDRH